MRETSIRVAKRCPHCNERWFDKVSLATGYLEVKCPNCGRTYRINLSFRKQSTTLWNYPRAGNW